jgi:RING finger protein 113A
LCKDYNETGFCGFGDSCKFVHDRGDYKAGWELDAEWDEQQRKLREGFTPEDLVIREEDQRPSIPEQTECGICKEELVKSIVETRCRHRFHEKCALAQSRKSKKCALCGVTIDGQFKIVKINTSS